MTRIQVAAEHDLTVVWVLALSENKGVIFVE